MKNVLILVIVVAAAAGGWWYAKRAPAPATEGSSTDLPGPGLPGPDGSTATPAVPDAPGGTAVPGPGSEPANPGVPVAAQADLAAAEALWAEAKAANPEDPTRDARAPRMARLYTAVLRACYADPAAQVAAERLVAERLTPLGTALFFSRNRYSDELFAVHTVQSGDVPDKIAKQFGMSYRYLNRLRGRDVNDGNLKVGDSLKVVNLKAVGGTSLHASKSQYRVDLYIGGVFARRYDMSIGAAETPTPVGTTFVTNVVYNPPWTNPVDGKIYQPGDPGNILGGVWIALDPDGIQGKTGIGLHGYTGEDQSLKKMASNGCLRLGNESIKELADVVSHPDRSPCSVEIVE